MNYYQTPGNYDNRFEAVVVCLNYADFLAQTLPINLSHVDRMVVVTGFDDHATQELCSRWSVECVLTDVFTEKGEPFNKGAAINMGIGALRQRGWILQMDADMLLPQTFRNMMDKSALSQDCIYGTERLNVVGWKAWKKLRANWWVNPQFCRHFLVSTPAELPLGSGVVHRQYGYTPIGFCQIWHCAYMHRYNLRYPETQGTAEHTDVQWALRWPRKNRILLPTVRLFHLESEPSRLGANWRGRKTKAFRS